MLHNICNIGSGDLPNMSALTLGCCAPSGSCVYIRQITPAHVTYIIYPISNMYYNITSYFINRVICNCNALLAVMSNK